MTMTTYKTTALRIYVVEPRGSGGMIHYAYQLCNGLSEAGEDVVLVTSKEYELENYPHKFRVEKFMHLWSRADPLQIRPSRNPLQALSIKLLRGLRRVFRGARLVLEWIRLIQYLLKARPDIVQFGSIEFPFESLFLGYLKYKGLTLSQICHEFEPRERSNNILVKINNHLLGNVFKSFSVMFFHSLSNQERFQSLYPHITSERFHIIPMGSGQIFPSIGDMEVIRKNLVLSYKLAGEEQVVLFFGNITPSKGIPDLVRAFAQVYSENKYARLVIAGKPLKYMDVDALFDLVTTLGVSDVIRFDMRYLPMEEVAPLIQLADVVVYPYVNSTQSASIQAAYSVGKPVVATRVGGLPDIVEDGKSGYLVPPGNPEKLATAILRILKDSILAKEMGTYAKELSETRFAWNPIASTVANVYRDFLKRHLENA
jgi:glycosyltransferase involved in cell wall biosynthesis